MTGAGATIFGSDVVLDGGITTISVEPWISEPAASTVPTTMPSTAVRDNATIAAVADARSVRRPGRLMTTVCCAWTVKVRRPKRRRAREIVFMMKSFLVFCGEGRIIHDSE